MLGFWVIILQAAHHQPAISVPWTDIAGPAGGFVALVVLLFFGGKGVYRLGVMAIDMVRGFGAGVINEWRRSNDEMRTWLASHATEEIQVMREIRDSLNRAAVDRERHAAEIKAVVERTAKETRHDIRNSIQALVAVPNEHEEDARAGERGRAHTHAARSR